MTLRVTHPVAILNVVELVLNIIIAGLVGGLGCLAGTSDGTTKFQFISAVVYGYLMHSTLHVAQIFLPGTIDKTLRLCVNGIGSILWIAAAALMLEAADAGSCKAIASFSEWYDRAIAGGILGLALFVSHLVNSYFVYRNLDE